MGLSAFNRMRRLQAEKEKEIASKEESKGAKETKAPTKKQSTKG